ncbi:hypothetical protein N7489_004623 [Penicillium chrysogenum]|uniref:uncharacterized protein n=1 Tax=Penicillium chrysogenum TaxID=5076 RepID=UPI0024DF2D38|nr:uncharacterized protein N7489_004623 [Penicillium chrysogenum]KAJ5244527.1 hypothetical protein N7489_004623 [Penicillium chrysogenum]KAJ5852988.1 hypothetical protein N7534_005531 [Penicillium rubens]
MGPIILEDAGGSTLTIRKVQGSRRTQEDRFTVLVPDNFSTTDKDLVLLLVCDGHCSDKVAEHAKEHVPHLIAQSRALMDKDYTKAIKSALEEEEALLLEEYDSGQDENAFSGSTVAICLVDLSSGILTTGNLGDSHVILGEAEGSSDAKQVKTTRLSEEHTPADLREEKRIVEAGGVVNWTRSLNMSRTLGDLQYKTPLNNRGSHYLSRSQERASGKKDKNNADFLSSNPAISEVRLDMTNHYALLLTTDGVTDILDDTAIVDRAAKLFWESLRPATEVADEITRESTIQPQSDNATCVTAFFKGDEG